MRPGDDGFHAGIGFRPVLAAGVLGCVFPVGRQLVEAQRLLPGFFLFQAGDSLQGLPAVAPVGVGAVIIEIGQYGMGGIGLFPGCFLFQEGDLFPRRRSVLSLRVVLQELPEGG